MYMDNKLWISLKLTVMYMDNKLGTNSYINNRLGTNRYINKQLGSNTYTYNKLGIIIYIEMYVLSSRKDVLYLNKHRIVYLGL